MTWPEKKIIDFLPARDCLDGGYSNNVPSSHEIRTRWVIGRRDAYCDLQVYTRVYRMWVGRTHFSWYLRTRRRRRRTDRVYFLLKIKNELVITQLNTLTRVVSFLPTQPYTHGTHNVNVLWRGRWRVSRGRGTEAIGTIHLYYLRAIRP